MLLEDNIPDPKECPAKAKRPASQRKDLLEALETTPDNNSRTIRVNKILSQADTDLEFLISNLDLLVAFNQLDGLAKIRLIAGGEVDPTAVTQRLVGLLDGLSGQDLFYPTQLTPDQIESCLEIIFAVNPPVDIPKLKLEPKLARRDLLARREPSCFCGRKWTWANCGIDVDLLMRTFIERYRSQVEVDQLLRFQEMGADLTDNDIEVVRTLQDYYDCECNLYAGERLKMALYSKPQAWLLSALMSPDAIVQTLGTLLDYDQGLTHEVFRPALLEQVTPLSIFVSLPALIEKIGLIIPDLEGLIREARRYALDHGVTVHQFGERVISMKELLLEHCPNLDVEVALSSLTPTQVRDQHDFLTALGATNKQIERHSDPQSPTTEDGRPVRPAWLW